MRRVEIAIVASSVVSISLFSLVGRIRQHARLGPVANHVHDGGSKAGEPVIAVRTTQKWPPDLLETILGFFGRWGGPKENKDACGAEVEIGTSFVSYPAVILTSFLVSVCLAFYEEGEADYIPTAGVKDSSASSRSSRQAALPTVIRLAVITRVRRIPYLYNLCLKSRMALERPHHRFGFFLPNSESGKQPLFFYDRKGLR